MKTDMYKHEPEINKKHYSCDKIDAQPAVMGTQIYQVRLACLLSGQLRWRHRRDTASHAASDTLVRHIWRVWNKIKR